MPGDWDLLPPGDPALTRRKQYDYSDAITSPLGRAWAAADPAVIFVECPHSRVVLDPNRAPPADAMSSLREFFRRLERLRAVGQISTDRISLMSPQGDVLFDSELAEGAMIENHASRPEVRQALACNPDLPRETLLALVETDELDRDGYAAVLEACSTMGSDFERGQVLQGVAEKMPADPDLIARYRRVARSLGDHERGQAEKALDRFSS